MSDVAIKLPEVPVIVIVLVVRPAEPLAVRVSVLFPFADLLLHTAVTPLGRGDVTVSTTFPANPA
jgi:hypothetical protein